MAVRCCFCGSPVKRKTSSETLCSVCEREDDTILVQVCDFLRAGKARMRHMYEVAAEVEGVTEKRVARWRRLGYIRSRPDGRVEIDDGTIAQMDLRLRRWILNKVGKKSAEPAEVPAERRAPPSRMVIAEQLESGSGISSTPEREGSKQ